MKISVRSILDFEFYEGHQWYVKFDGFNILNSGGDLGVVFPASSVQENVYKVTYDTLTVGNNFSVEVPQSVSYLGDVTVTFWEDGATPVPIESLMRTWADELHNDNAINDLTSASKIISIYRISRMGQKKESKYEVLPPRELVFAPSGSVDAYTNTISMPIVKVLKLSE